MTGLVHLTDFFTSRQTITQVNAALAAHGIQRIACTLIPGRCGSTMLAGLAASYGFGTGVEAFNELSREDYMLASPDGSFRTFLDQALQATTRNGVCYFQITPMRLAKLLAICPLHQSEPGIGFTLLFRRNVVAQAISYVNALSSGVWHSFEGGEETKNVPSPPYGEVLPIDWWIRSLLTTEFQAVNALGLPPGTPLPLLYYEDLAAATTESLIAFLRMNRHPIDSARLMEALSQYQGPVRLPKAGYVQTYLKAVNGRPDLFALLSARATRGFEANTSDLFLAEFGPRPLQAHGNPGLEPGEVHASSSLKGV